jgi:hypothetical protein
MTANCEVASLDDVAAMPSWLRSRLEVRYSPISSACT